MSLKCAKKRKVLYIAMNKRLLQKRNDVLVIDCISRVKYDIEITNFVYFDYE